MFLKNKGKITIVSFMLFSHATIFINLNDSNIGFEHIKEDLKKQKPAFETRTDYKKESLDDLADVTKDYIKIPESTPSKKNHTRTGILTASYEGTDLSGAQLPRMNFSDAELQGADLSGAKLIKANLSNADLTEANLTDADLSEADLSGAILSGADLTGANLSETDLFGADLKKANLSRANLTKANLSNADLTEANLTDADLSRAILSRANLTKANLSKAKFWSKYTPAQDDLKNALRQLSEVKTLFNAKISPILSERLKQRYPELFIKQN